MPEIRESTTAGLGVETLYALLRLRTDVFVVEQHCPYPELDGRDLEPLTRHVWTADEFGPSSYLRLLVEQPESLGTTRIGRVCTRRDARGAGLAATLMDHVLVRMPGPVVLDAQAHLTGWYARYGFEVTGEEYLDDGIPHRPMRRSATVTT